MNNHHKLMFSDPNGEKGRNCSELCTVERTSNRAASTDIEAYLASPLLTPRYRFKIFTKQQVLRIENSAPTNCTCRSGNQRERILLAEQLRFIYHLTYKGTITRNSFFILVLPITSFYSLSFQRRNAVNLRIQETIKVRTYIAMM